MVFVFLCCDMLDCFAVSCKSLLASIANKPRPSLAITGSTAKLYKGAAASHGIMIKARRDRVAAAAAHQILIAMVEQLQITMWDALVIRCHCGYSNRQKKSGIMELVN